MNTRRNNRSGGAFLPATAALVMLAGSIQATPEFALKISDHDGSHLIPGEAVLPQDGWIEVLSFGNGMVRLPGGDGTVLTTACSHQGFTFRKRIDKSTPLLQQALVTGLLLPAVQAVQLGSDDPTTAGSSPVAVTLRHVQVTGYRLLGSHSAASGDPLPTEEITLNYSEVEWTYRHGNPADHETEEVSATLVAFLGTEDPAFDDDNDGISNDLDEDDDNDGIKDSDELRGGSNPYRDDADEDLDGDGRTNFEEVIANTRMNDPSDFFGIESFRSRKTDEGMQVTVSFPVSGGRHYRLLASPDPRIPKEAWFVLDEFDMPEGSEEEAADIELNPNVLNNATRLFFRVEVSLLP